MHVAESRYWRFENRPTDMIAADTFGWHSRALGAPGEGQLLVQNLVLSMDATNRLWLGEREELYMEPVHLGDSMKGFGLCRVIDSRSQHFQEGQLVSALTEWSDYSVLDASAVQPFAPPEGVGLEEAFGVLSIAGPSAYHGLLNIGRPRPGETVVVTAASGAVGTLAGQIAKLNGCRVVGTAGSDEKCDWLVREAGFDAAVNYRRDDVAAALERACPYGIDVQFENVGGDILDQCLRLMNVGGRVVICGLISMYNSEENMPGPRMFHNTIMKRLRIEGFVILDHAAKMPRIHAQLARWLQAGVLNFRLNRFAGLERAPEALTTLYTSANDGKVLVRVAE